MPNTEKRSVFLTGASQGIGKEIALELARKKKASQLFLIARTEKALLDLKEICEKENAELKVEIIVCDLAKQEERKKLFPLLSEVDVLIHNAGFGTYRFAEDFTEEEERELFEVNVFAPMELSRKILPFLYQKKQGQLIFIASQASKMVTPKSSLYSASKFALRGYAEGVRLEAKKKGVYVSVVNPGPVKTGFFKRADKDGTYSASVQAFSLDAASLAKKIVRLLDKPKRELNLPRSMALGAKLFACFPSLGDWFLGNVANRK